MKARVGVMAVLLCGLMVFGGRVHAMKKKIVVFDGGVSRVEKSRLMADWEDWGALGIADLPLVNGVILEVPDAACLERIATDPRVASVEEDQRVSLQAVSGPELGRVVMAADGESLKGRRPWGILRLYEQPYHPLSLTSPYDPDCVPRVIEDAMDQGHMETVKVAFLDTGIDDTHPGLAGQVDGGIDLVNMIRGIPMDNNGHGTHVAATVGAGGTGLARGCRLYGIKILGREAAGDLSAVIRGLQWAMDHRMDIVCMGIAFAKESQAVHMAIKKACDAGITVVAAAGNRQKNGGGGSGGAEGGGSAVTPWPVVYPAAYPEVISVGAHGFFGETADFSNTGPLVDLTAPGTDIVSGHAMPAGRFGFCSGTSMAASHVAGAVALMLSLDRSLNAGLSPLTPGKVKQILVGTTFNGTLNLVGALKKVGARWQRGAM